ncbi:MAG: transforming growth factor-beta-induced protein [Planctomycetota bacterium]|jgi:transforming growth factor-beta-induced protein
MMNFILLPLLISIPTVTTDVVHPVEAVAVLNSVITEAPDPSATSMALVTGGPLTILETAASTGRFDTLAAALTAANLVSTLEGPGPFTVFAPTDAAFAAFPQQRLNYLLQPRNVDVLTSALTFHVVSGAVDANTVLGSPFVTTLNGQRAEISSSLVQIEGSNFLATDIICSNGIIHIIDKVMLPEFRNVTGLTASTPGFGTLNAALIATGLDLTLNSPGDFTVFAPTDAAFQALPAGVLDSLLANPAALTDVLLYHVTPGRLYASDVIAVATLPMLNMADTTISVGPMGAMINNSLITVTDIEVANGVVHVIDVVLVPGP